MKRFIITLLCFSFMMCPVSAANLAESTESVLTKLEIKVDGDISSLMYCKNYSFIKAEYREIIASALKNGILSVTGGVVLPESEDLSSLYSGLSSYTIKSKNHRLVAGKYSGYKIAGATVNSETLCLDPLNETDVFTAMIDKKNNVTIAWRATDVVLPELYRGRVFICGDGDLVLYNAERYSFDSWVDVMAGKDYIDVPCTDVLDLSEEEVNLNYMDSVVYFMADGYEGKIKPLCFEF